MAFTMHRPAGGPELSVVVPTFNERDNIELLLARREAALCGIEWEVIYVDDDSSDGIAHKVRSLAQAKFAHPRCPADRPPGLVYCGHLRNACEQRAILGGHRCRPRA